MKQPRARLLQTVARKFDAALIHTHCIKLLRPNRSMFEHRQCRPLAVLTLGAMIDLAEYTPTAAGRIAGVTHPTALSIRREWLTHNETVRQGWQAELIASHIMAEANIVLSTTYARQVLRRNVWLYPLIRHGTVWKKYDSDDDVPTRWQDALRNVHSLSEWLVKIAEIPGV